MGQEVIKSAASHRISSHFLELSSKRTVQPLLLCAGSSGFRKELPNAVAVLVIHSSFLTHILYKKLSQLVLSP